MAVVDQIKKYYNDGFSCVEILEFLAKYHGYNISLSTLKRRLREQGLHKRALVGRRQPIEIITTAIQNELYGSGADIGYRRMHAALLKKGINCRREDVRKIIKELDPEGVDLRRKRRLRRRKYVSQGPNYAWHIDGHDKLKPFGFSIHGCIDGFSRRLIWLKVGPSNKMPEIVAKYYLDAVTELGGVPKKLKADNGTEHSLIEPIHIYLSSLDEDNENALESFSIIPSTQNQRIEAYWSLLQRDRIGWWKRFFRDMVDLDLFHNGDPVLLDCIRFCFMDLLRKDLDSIRNEWNVHILSSSRNSGPRGRPDSMFFLSHMFNTEDFLSRVDTAEIENFYPQTDNNVRDYSNEFQEFAEVVMAEANRARPSNTTDALYLYIFLLQRIYDNM